MTIKMDPRTGMYIVPELMDQGPVPQPHNFRPSPNPQGQDTIRADLTPGEAVIPAPVAQDPQFQPMIHQMVEEGRKRNAMRGGTDSVPALADGLSPWEQRYGQPTRQVNPVDTAVNRFGDLDRQNQIRIESGKQPISPTDVSAGPIVPEVPEHPILEQRRQEEAARQEAIRQTGLDAQAANEQLVADRVIAQDQELEAIAAQEAQEAEAARQAEAAKQAAAVAQLEADAANQAEVSAQLDAQEKEMAMAADAAAGIIRLPDGTPISGPTQDLVDLHDEEGNVVEQISPDEWNKIQESYATADGVKDKPEVREQLSKAWDWIKGITDTVFTNEAVTTAAVSYVGGLLLGYDSEDSWNYARKLGVQTMQQTKQARANQALALQNQKIKAEELQGQYAREDFVRGDEHAKAIDLANRQYAHSDSQLVANLHSRAQESEAGRTHQTTQNALNRRSQQVIAANTESGRNKRHIQTLEANIAAATTDFERDIYKIQLEKSLNKPGTETIRVNGNQINAIPDGENYIYQNPQGDWVSVGPNGYMKETDYLTGQRNARRVIDELLTVKDDEGRDLNSAMRGEVTNAAMGWAQRNGINPNDSRFIDAVRIASRSFGREDENISADGFEKVMDAAVVSNLPTQQKYFKRQEGKQKVRVDGRWMIVYADILDASGGNVNAAHKVLADKWDSLDKKVKDYYNNELAEDDNNGFITFARDYSAGGTGGIRTP